MYCGRGRVGGARTVGKTGAPASGAYRKDMWMPLAALPRGGPAARAKARSVFLLPIRSFDIEAHRPAVLSEPFQGWVSQAILQECEDGLQPKWLAAERFVDRGWADAHVTVAFGTTLCPEVWHILHEIFRDWCMQ